MANKFNILIKHMRITDHGNEISSGCSPDRGTDTMMLVTGGPTACQCVLERLDKLCCVIVEGVVSGGTLGGLGVGTQRYFE